MTSIEDFEDKYIDSIAHLNYDTSKGPFVSSPQVKNLLGKKYSRIHNTL
jgi:hypothetical protein